MSDVRSLSDDERRLAELGYKQELNRALTGFQNFALSFTIISILSGALTLYGTGINYGGPIQQAWGWPIVSVFVIIVALAFWGWLWGIGGALLAVPLASAAAIICSSFERTRWIAMLISRGPLVEGGRSVQDKR